MIFESAILNGATNSGMEPAVPWPTINQLGAGATLVGLEGVVWASAGTTERTTRIRTAGILDFTFFLHFKRFRISINANRLDSMLRADTRRNPWLLFPFPT